MSAVALFLVDQEKSRMLQFQLGFLSLRGAFFLYSSSCYWLPIQLMSPILPHWGHVEYAHTCKVPHSERNNHQMFVPSHTHTHLLPSPSLSSSELRSMVNMSSSSENSSPLSSRLPPPASGRAFLLLFLLFFVTPPSLCCGPRLWTGSEPQGMVSACVCVCG